MDTWLPGIRGRYGVPTAMAKATASKPVKTVPKTARSEAAAVLAKAAARPAAKSPPKPRRSSPTVDGAKAQVLSMRKLALARISPVDGVSLVNQTVDALRRAVLSAPGPNVFIGSEEQLIAALGVSRPTFRQAAKLLRHENLLTIKRGMGGGFFTQAPSGEAVSRMAAIYLNSQGTTMRQISEVASPLQAEAARQLARNPDRAVRAGLTEFLARYRSGEVPEAEQDPIRRMLAFERELGVLAGNPAISLVMHVMRDLLRDVRHSYFTLTPERIQSYEAFQERLARAVLDGDPEMAALISDRYTSEFASWLPDDRMKLDA